MAPKLWEISGRCMTPARIHIRLCTHKRPHWNLHQGSAMRNQDKVLVCTPCSTVVFRSKIQNLLVRHKHILSFRVLCCIETETTLYMALQYTTHNTIQCLANNFDYNLENIHILLYNSCPNISQTPLIAPVDMGHDFPLCDI